VVFGQSNATRSVDWKLKTSPEERHYEAHVVSLMYAPVRFRLI
jgi:hypothetical protein